MKYQQLLKCFPCNSKLYDENLAAETSIRSSTSISTELLLILIKRDWMAINLSSLGKSEQNIFDRVLTCHVMTQHLQDKKYEDSVVYTHIQQIIIRSGGKTETTIYKHKLNSNETLSLFNFILS